MEPQVEDRSSKDGGCLGTLRCALCHAFFCEGETIVQYVMADGFIFLLCDECAPKMAPTPGFDLLIGEMEVE